MLRCSAAAHAPGAVVSAVTVTAAWPNPIAGLLVISFQAA
jgi:hypothetical protein